MFGYIRPAIPELKVKEYEQYKGIYCSLCKTMGKEYGKVSRFALSYDATFLSLLMIGLSGDCTGFERGHCVFNPLKRCTFTKGNEDSYRFAAALTVMMTDYKIHDDIADSGFWGKVKGYLLLPLVSGANKKAAKNQPELQKILAETIGKQGTVEAEENPCVDACAEPTALLLQKTFGMVGGENQSLVRVLETFGYFLGKWVYMMDAADDLEKDMKQKQFNPFVNLLGLTGSSTADEIKEAKKTCNESLNAVLSQVNSAVNLIDFTQFDPIIHNIIFEGLPNMQKELLFKKENL